MKLNTRITLIVLLLAGCVYAQPALTLTPVNESGFSSFVMAGSGLAVEQSAVQSGEDRTVTVTLSGNVPRYVKLKANRFMSNAVDKGNASNWDNSYLKAKGPDLCYPGVKILGATYYTTATFGVGLMCSTSPHLWYWDINNGNAMCLIVDTTAGKTFTISERISPNKDWKHLLAPYKASFPAPAYNARHGIMAAFYGPTSTVHITAENPLGYNGNSRRLDTVSGAQATVDKLKVPLENVRGMGCMFWAIGGYEPRKEQYRTDFDVIPPQVSANLPALNAGLSCGLATRPGSITVRRNWTQDSVLPITAAMFDTETKPRFQNALAWGFDHFYLDSFGLTRNDLAILRKLRELIGPDVMTYAENWNDRTALDSGIYYDARNTSLEWSLQAVQWLVPDVPIIVAGLSHTAASYEAQLAKHRCPIIEDYLMPEASGWLAPVIDNYLTVEGKWK